MSKRRTGIDANLLIAAWSGQDTLAELIDSAKSLAQSYGLAAMDAIHIAVAVEARADEFISGEKPGKPMFRIREIKAESLWAVLP